MELFLLSSIFTILSIPFPAATCSAVLPSRFLALQSAPMSRSVLTVSTKPFEAAHMRGVQPLLSGASTLSLPTLPFPDREWSSLIASLACP
eukprot:CAMPEP_0118663526 /NCGR_PEP_ID=MMETSP0785-20121206/17477_1 /TAXON_ID=91992 /ORGANISM="Bolidomonas pacifica, Strain CCMP 1866" /LENGTH=90 /DNA_ID=CAMNT_0006557273 /DNA_START=153 /DNA_END=425 /DNA_ORIENTATION=+